LSFREQGYLPLAFFNFVAQLSWSPGKEERIYSREEMIEAFSLEHISKGSPIFDLNKLQWLNSRLINEMPVSELISELRPWLEKKGLWADAFLTEKKEWLERLVALVRPRSRTLLELTDMLAPFISNQVDYDPEAVRKHLLDPCLEELLPKLKADFEQLTTFMAPELEQVVRGRAEKEGVKAAVFIHALRVLLLGRAVGPGIFETLEMMGKEKTLARLGRLAEVRKSVQETGEVRNG
ncbi:MAG TPA: glutamate--tRNA ligase family protein, partial [Candidatus Saccharicenans sp.]|nr:glutamate--tRNA ligase family protein [Candidatus Saccharicenans sp.]HRV05906.1 glutamate--tRNA ligase family protein [Candidatus Saccharicenans sp.]